MKDTVRNLRNRSAEVAARAVRLRPGNREFARRRKQLARIMGRDAIAILPAARVTHRNSDVEHPYRQDSDFFYLTGFVEPDSVAVLVPGPGGRRSTYCSCATAIRCARPGTDGAPARRRGGALRGG